MELLFTMLSGKLHLAAHVMLATQSVNSYRKHYLNAYFFKNVGYRICIFQS